MTSPQAHLPIVLLQIKSASQSTLPITETRHCLFLSIGLQLSASPSNYSNQPITSFHRNQGTPHVLVTTKYAFHSSSLFTLLLRATLLGPLWHVLSSFPRQGVYVTNKLLLISSVQCRCCMFSHPHNSRARIHSSSIRVTKRRSKK